MQTAKDAFEKGALGNGHLGNCFPGTHLLVLGHPGTQRLLRPDQSFLATAQLDGRLWHHPRGAGFTGMQNASVMGSERFPPRLQKKIWEARQCAPRGKV